MPRALQLVTKEDLLTALEKGEKYFTEQQALLMASGKTTTPEKRDKDAEKTADLERHDTVKNFAHTLVMIRTSKTLSNASAQRYVLGFQNELATMPPPTGELYTLYRDTLSLILRELDVELPKGDRPKKELER